MKLNILSVPSVSKRHSARTGFIRDCDGGERVTTFSGMSMMPLLQLIARGAPLQLRDQSCSFASPFIGYAIGWPCLVPPVRYQRRVRLA
jgi:hypothetical protein